jgi:hypothetical protein
MKNLAGGNPVLVDVQVSSELTRARVPMVEGQRSEGEVPYSITGKLGAFTFKRAWTYWVVEGPMPLVLAKGLYADPAGKTDIRAGGHAGGPAPGEQATRRAPDGREVCSVEDWHELETLHVRHGIDISGYVRADAPEARGERLFVETYHIDSELGLRVFADVIHQWLATESFVDQFRVPGSGEPVADRSKEA